MLRMSMILLCTRFLFSITASELVDRMEKEVKPQDMQSELTMVLTNKKGRVKTLKLKSISNKDSERQIIWFLEPKRDRGIALLKIEHKEKADEMRMWLPAFKKIRRITSEKKTGSFMGSDLSYEDLYSRSKEDYSYSLIESKNIEGVECYVLVSTPSKELLSEYSKHVSWIAQESLLPIKEESYDENGELLKKKEMKYTDLGKYSLVKEIFVKNVQKEHSTHLSFDNTVVDSGIKDGYFNENKLKRIPK